MDEYNVTGKTIASLEEIDCGDTQQVKITFTDGTGIVIRSGPFEPVGRSWLAVEQSQ